MNERLCKCGCGEIVLNGAKYVKGHNIKRFRIKAKKKEKKEKLDYFQRLGKFE